MVSYFDRWMSVVHRQQLLLVKTSPKLLDRNDPYVVNCSNCFGPLHIFVTQAKIDIDF